MLTVVDTGPLYALANKDDRYHDACRRWLEFTPAHRLLVPALVVTEVCYLLSSRVGAAVTAEFLEGLASGEPFEVIAPTQDDFARMAELIKQYASLSLDAADASVIALAERFDIETIATADRKDFRIVKPRHIDAFASVSELDL